MKNYDLRDKSICTRHVAHVFIKDKEFLSFGISLYNLLIQFSNILKHSGIFVCVCISCEPKKRYSICRIYHIDNTIHHMHIHCDNHVMNVQSLWLYIDHSFVGKKTWDRLVIYS